MSSYSDDTPRQEGKRESLALGDGPENPIMSYDQMQAEMRKLKQENERKDQEIERKDQEIESLKQDLKKYSIEEVLARYNGIPRMEENSCASQGAAVGRSNHMPATIEKDFFKATERLQGMWSEFPLWFKDDKDVPLFSSLIERRFMEDEELAKLEHVNESSVQHHVCNLLRDVRRCMGLEREVEIFPEMSLFSLRPDIVVVRFRQAIVLIIELKNPQDNLFKSEAVAGQMYDYCKCMQQMGNEHPFAVLSCYNQMCFVRLDRDDDVYPELLQKAWTVLHEEKGRLSEKYKQRTCSTATKASVSPGRDRMPRVGIPNYEYTVGSKKFWMNLQQLPSMNWQKQPRKTRKKAGLPPGKVVYSDVYDTSKAFQAFTYALACGMASVDHMEQDNDRVSNNLMPSEGETLHRPLATIKKNNGFCFETAKMTFTLKKRPELGQVKQLHLHCVLGSGQSGKTLLASTSSGIGLAVKLFLFSPEWHLNYSAEDRQKRLEKQKRERKAQVMEECRRWKKLYPMWNAFVKELQLNGIWCLTMPYVAPILTEQRQGFLGRIEEELHRFADEGFIYKDSDLRWRHIGQVMMGEGNDEDVKIVLVDLGSLKEVKGAKGDQIHDYVREQVEELKRRAGNEEEKKPGAVIA